MKRKKRIIICVVCSVIFAILISAAMPFMPLLRQTIQVELTRPKAAYLTPDFSENVTDIRITVVERNINPKALWGDAFDNKGNVYQIYYGYYSSDQWTDIPHENYTLCRLKGSNVFNVAGGSHVVSMGSHILIAIAEHNDYLNEIKDSKNSEVIEIIEYHPTNTNTASYLFCENALELGTDDYSRHLSLSFAKWYYIILEADNIPDDYSITLSSYDKKTNELMDEYTYTYDDIMEALNRK